MMQFNFHREHDADLLTRLKAGDEQAWAEYVRDYGLKVYKYLLTNLPDRESVEDTLSETMMAAVKEIEKFEGHNSLATLTFALARRKVADFWRKRPSTQALESLLPDTPLATELVEDRLEFLDAMSRLPKASQEALLLRYQIGLSVDEIAKVMARSYKGVESLLSRARQQLHEALEDVLSSSEPYAAEFQPLLHSVLRRLHDQIQRCLAHGMTEEAAIFTHYLEMVNALAHEADLSTRTESGVTPAPAQLPPAR